jgi:redox-sensitive bicupin YhaK (pirin superfamily)
MERRTLLGALAAAPVAAACERTAVTVNALPPREVTVSPPVVQRVEPLAFPWQTPDPFLFCVHHDDAYPRGDARLGPAASLAGREIGADFSGRDGWSMYHGDVVPGFPQHPHRGFETVTVTRRGFIDHSDSLGATARYGGGDVQWLTAGKGIVHAEMFPLVSTERDNPVELFQLWLNLPRVDKMVDPHFTMFWADQVPRVSARDEAGRRTELTVVAGRFGDARPGVPPPHSWASRPDSDVAIWTLAMEPGANFTLPPARPGSHRMLYFFRGSQLLVGERAVPARQAVTLHADRAAPLVNGHDAGEILVLQGRPIGEPVVQHGPFVMNTREEIRQAFLDYQRTRFGGWPWPVDDPTHGRAEGRFARHADGRIERA